MKLIWVLNARKLKRTFIIMVAALFTAGVLYMEKSSMSFFSQSLLAIADEPPQAIYSVQTDKKQLALTFDISWGNERPGPILDILEKQGIKKATFFVSSPWAQHHPDMVNRIKEMGFEIGSHGHKHINYSHLKDEEIREQLNKSKRIIRSVTGQSVKLIRTPNGDIDKRVLRIANELRFTVIKWDTDSKDWLNPGVDNIVNNVTSKAHPGDIVLLHASDSSKQTHEALPLIIQKLKSDGYEFVTVSELINGVESKIKEAD